MARFSKRHYEMIAEAMQGAALRLGTQPGPRAIATRGAHLGALADLFRHDNPAFDRDRFLRACIPGANVSART